MFVFSHLLNDQSGSPRVLRSAIAALAKTGDGSRLFVGSDGEGCLDETSIGITRYWYKRFPYRLLTLFSYLFSQLCLLLRLLHTQGIQRDAIIYVNTLLPFGAAFFGWMTGRPVIYHLHEISVSPLPLRWFLMTVARHIAWRLIYVSDFHRACLRIPGVPASTVHNAVDETFLTLAEASQYQHRRDDCFNVLMLSSLRDYKGVPELLALASRLIGRKDIHFYLVVNDDEHAIRRYFASITIPENITIHPRTDSPAVYYAIGSLLLNLSRPDEWVETFGLTLIEAMAFGIPVIAPPVGGPVEIVKEGQQGYLIDCRSGVELAERVLQLADDEALCLRLSSKARQKTSQFRPVAFAGALRKALDLKE